MLGEGVLDLEPSSCLEALRCLRSSSMALLNSTTLVLLVMGCILFLLQGLRSGPFAMISERGVLSSSGVSGWEFRRCRAIVLALPNVGLGAIGESSSFSSWMLSSCSEGLE